MIPLGSKLAPSGGVISWNNSNRECRIHFVGKLTKVSDSEPSWPSCFILERVNPLLNDKILDKFKLKLCAQDKMCEPMFQDVKKILWKKEQLLVTSIFSLCFQKVFILRLLKVGVVW